MFDVAPEHAAHLRDGGQAHVASQLQDRGQRERRHREQQHPGLRLGGGAIEGLACALPASGEHGRAEHQEGVAHDRAHQRRLDDLLQSVAQREDGDDQLGRVTERDVDQAADAGSRAGCELLRGVTHQGGRGHDRESRGCEHERWRNVCQFKDEGDGNEGAQAVHGPHAEDRLRLCPDRPALSAAERAIHASRVPAISIGSPSSSASQPSFNRCRGIPSTRR